MKTVRCFLAVNLDLKTANNISDLQQKLIADTSQFTSKFRWIPPQNMHITVRFLGNITEPMIQAIKDNLDKITQSSDPITMETGAVRVFDPESPRVLHCEIKDPTGALTQFVARVHESLENIGFKELSPPWVPHVTLARIEDGVSEEIQKLLADHATAPVSESLVRTLVCYQSNQVKPGLDYQLLWKLTFQKRTKTVEYPTYGENETSAAFSAEYTPQRTTDTSEPEQTEQGEDDFSLELAEQGEQEQ